jgi:hypothetical protein
LELPWSHLFRFVLLHARDFFDKSARRARRPKTGLQEGCRQENSRPKRGIAAASVAIAGAFRILLRAAQTSHIVEMEL